MTQSILLHCCCAPCASYVIEYLIQDYKITLFFYNPNIEPQAEYDKRKSEMTRLLEAASLISEVEVLECEYDNAAYVNAVLSLRGEPEGGKRCKACYELRLAETAKKAALEKFDIFATTLSVSPHKDALLLNEIGSQKATELGIKYLQSDFKKQNGYLRSIELSKKYDLYRQNYCGCIKELLC